MGKLDALRKTAGDNAAESMGPSRSPALHRASTPPAATSAPDRLRGVVRSREAAEIPTDRIVADPDQPREEFEPAALERLAESLKARGQLQPVRVRWDEGRGAYVILIGERRWRAARMAGIQTMSAVIVEASIDPGELLAIQLVENCLREDLKPIEQAKAFRALIDRNGWSARQVARELAVEQSSVVRALALLELPEPVQEQVEQGTLAPATAYEVSKLGDAAAQTELAARVVAGGLTRQEAAEAVRDRRVRRRASARPRTVRYRVGPGAVVTVELGRRSPLTLVEALEHALAAAKGAEAAENVA